MRPGVFYFQPQGDSMEITFATGAMPLFENGYEPIPIIQGTKKPSLPPGTKENPGWPEKTINKEQMEEWLSNGKGSCAIGIRCGTITGINVDIYDKNISTAIGQYIKDTHNNGNPILYRIGLRPKFLIPCRIEGLKGKLSSTAYTDSNGNTNKIEVLSHKNYFVSHGIHEDTKKPYTWHNGDLININSSELIEIAEDDLYMLFDYFDELAAKIGWEKTKTIKKIYPEKDHNPDDIFSNIDYPKPSLEDLKECVRKLPFFLCDEYESWIEIGMAIHHSTDGSNEGFELFNSWSKLSEKYESKKYTAEKWKSFSTENDEENLITFGTIVNYVDLYKETTNIYTVEDNEDNEDNEDKEDTEDCPQLSSFKLEDKSQNQHGAFANEIKEYISFHTADVVYYQLCQDLGYMKRRERKSANNVLLRMVKDGEIIKHPTKRGVYCTVVEDIEEMVPVAEQEPRIPFRLPLELHKKIKILPGTVIVVGGATNAGKTLLGIECLRLWIDDLSSSFDVTSVKIKPRLSLRESTLRALRENYPENFVKNFSGFRYLNSEMSEGELGHLLASIGADSIKLNSHVQWVRRTHDFPRAVLTNGITIVDFLQIHKEFYEIGGIVKEMADNVGSGILVIMIQKKSGESAPRGGDFAIERARIAIMLDYAGGKVATAHLRKVKYPKDYQDNPQHMEIDYRISSDLRLKPITKLQRINKKERQAMNERYTQQAKEDDVLAERKEFRNENELF